MAEEVCPKDGQTKDWHNKIAGYHAAHNKFGDRRPKTFGDAIGCYFGEDYWIGEAVIRNEQ